MARWRAAVGGATVGFVAVVLAAGTAGPAAAQKTKTKAKAESLPINEKVVEFARK